MKTLVIYDSQFGNTRLLAEEIGHVLEAQSTVKILPAAETDAWLFREADLLVLGGPTVAHGLSPAMQHLLESAPPCASGADRPQVLAFDTRLRWPKWLSGSAADKIAHHLADRGYTLLAPPASFLVQDSKGPLAEGEQARAVAWVQAALKPVAVTA
jgi:flavodoxin